jgi:FAD/FMN-containing dehydrogenase/Fe-S oxidoreductase
LFGILTHMLKSDPGEISPNLLHDLQQAGFDHSADRVTRILYSTDASIYQIMPRAVVWPRDKGEVGGILDIARKYQTPVLPRGGGSSLAGQAIGDAIILDFSRNMDQVLDICPEENWVKVQSGMVLGSLNRQLLCHKLMFGPDPASADRATIGGILGNNATGSHSILYGMSHDHLLECEVVLSDSSLVNFHSMESKSPISYKRTGSLEERIIKGLPELSELYRDEIRDRYPKTFRNVAGYNLNIISQQKVYNPAVMLAGSEGTLGVITAAKLNLVPVPVHHSLYLIHFDEIGAALECVPHILESKPSAVELIDQVLIRLARANPAYRSLLDAVQGDPAAVLAVEYQGKDPGAVTEKESNLSAFGHVVPLLEETQQARIWKARKVGLGILFSKRGDAKPTTFIEDAAVPVEHLAEYALEIKKFGEEIGVGEIAIYAHASAGLLHIRPVVNLKNKRGLEQMRLLAEKSLELVLRFGGTIAGEHGEGLARGEFSRQLYGPELTRAFKQVKELFDPAYLLNPGKVVDPPRMDQDEFLRYGLKYQTPYNPEETLLSFKEDQGFDRAVEMCNGAGVCRQLDEGVMCPSFKATRDETHSTRGRANMLRAAISGKLGAEGLASQELYDVLDLCLSCQACASECPSAVDMSKIKAEFTYQYYRFHGTPFRSWFFANIWEISRMAQPFSFLINPILQSPLKQFFSLIGIHPDRQMPPFAREKFTSWHKKNSRGLSEEVNKGVVFFYDTYLEYNYPHIGQAVVKIFQKAGLELIVLREKLDSGRPAYSKGLLKKAQNLALKNLELLKPYAEKGMAIIGSEPSVMVMLKKEYRDLAPGLAADLVSKSAMLVEEFLLQEISSGKIEFTYDKQPRKILYHGHCQQKAHFGTTNTIQLLEQLPECEVEEVQSTCCGMAGAFGYEKEHYQLSLEIAELGLAPQIRESSPDTIICASGTSCREQIDHTTQREAVHPLEIFADAII